MNIKLRITCMQNCANCGASFQGKKQFARHLILISNNPLNMPRHHYVVKYTHAPEHPAPEGERYKKQQRTKRGKSLNVLVRDIHTHTNSPILIPLGSVFLNTPFRKQAATAFGFVFPDGLKSSSQTGQFDWRNFSLPSPCAVRFGDGPFCCRKE